MFFIIKVRNSIFYKKIFKKWTECVSVVNPSKPAIKTCSYCNLYRLKLLHSNGKKKIHLLLRYIKLS